MCGCVQPPIALSSQYPVSSPEYRVLECWVLGTEYSVLSSRTGYSLLGPSLRQPGPEGLIAVTQPFSSCSGRGRGGRVRRLPAAVDQVTVIEPQDQVTQGIEGVIVAVHGLGAVGDDFGRAGIVVELGLGDEVGARRADDLQAAGAHAGGHGLNADIAAVVG